MLPDGDGAQIMRHLRERNRAIPVCVTTGVNDRARLAEVSRLNPRCLC
jgi:DNA-binding NarL/FixJ family response regulator